MSVFSHFCLHTFLSVLCHFSAPVFVFVFVAFSAWSYFSLCLHTCLLVLFCVSASLCLCLCLCHYLSLMLLLSLPACFSFSLVLHFCPSLCLCFCLSLAAYSLIVIIGTCLSLSHSLPCDWVTCKQMVKLQYCGQQDLHVNCVFLCRLSWSTNIKWESSLMRVLHLVSWVTLAEESQNTLTFQSVSINTYIYITQCICRLYIYI